MEITNSRHGVFAVIAAIAIQLTLGICYIWSVFQTGVALRLFEGNNAAAGLSFSLLLAGLSFVSPVAGKLAAKYSTRVVVFAGGILLSAGFFIASRVTPEFAWMFWMSYGVLAGIGMGFTYSTTIACAQKWYPHKKGMVTGIIVSALGFGGVVFTPLIEYLIRVFGGVGIGEFNTFMVLAIIFLVVCSIGSCFLRTPPDGYMMDAVKPKAGTAAPSAPTRNFTASEMLKTPHFYLLTTAFLLSVVGGLMMIGFARPIAVARGLEATATIGVLAIAISNSFGRLFWGTISDKMGRITTILTLLVCSGILSLLVNVVDGHVIYVIIALIGFCFGGFLSNYPSLTADLFGVRNMATNYGFVLFGFGIGAIAASQIGGFYMNRAADDISLLSPAFIIAATCAAVGLVLMILLSLVIKKVKLG